MKSGLKELVLSAALATSFACSNNVQSNNPVCNSEAARVNANVAKMAAAETEPGVEKIILYTGGYDKTRYNREFMECFVGEVTRLTEGRYKVTFEDAGADWGYTIKSPNAP